MIATVGGVRDAREARAAVLGAGWETGRSITAAVFGTSGCRRGTSDGLGIGSSGGKSNSGDAVVWSASWAAYPASTGEPTRLAPQHGNLKSLSVLLQLSNFSINIPTGSAETVAAKATAAVKYRPRAIIPKI
jgi:hypothetical protein